MEERRETRERSGKCIRSDIEEVVGIRCAGEGIRIAIVFGQILRYEVSECTQHKTISDTTSEYSFSPGNCSVPCLFAKKLHRDPDMQGHIP